MNIKHEEKILSCNQCEGKFKSSICLSAHVANKHFDGSEVEPEENQLDAIFVFSESMLDEVLDHNIQLQVKQE